MTQVASAHLGESLGTDFFSVREQFTDEQWSHFITVRRFVDLAEAGRLTPTVARDLLHAMTRLGPARGYYYQLISTLGWTSLPWLPKLRPPTLILAGDDDPLIPLVNARIMHHLIRRSKLHVYRGGHLELAADAARLASVVEAFLTADPAQERSQQ